MGDTRKCFVLINTLLKILGSYPVSESDNGIIFRWYSSRTFWSLFSILVALVGFGRSIYENHMKSRNLLVIVALNVSAVAIQLSFIFMAKHWPELGKECDKIDFYMESYRFPKRLKLKLEIICTILAIISLSLYCAIDFALPSGSITVLRICVKNFRKIPSFATALSILLTAIGRISHFQIGTLRSLVDLYIITVSMILAERLSQVAERVGLLIEKKIRNEEAWKQTREDYQRVCAFIEKWDKILGYLVLSSIMSNSYILLLQLQSILSISSRYVYQTLGTVACLHTLLRCMVVCYIAGNVYTQGTRLIEFVVLTPPDVYNAEIERIIVQLRQTRPALTGKQLFTMKHSLIVQILGAIASHEIILLQYYTPAKA